jgi:hypothetical protein
MPHFLVLMAYLSVQSPFLWSARHAVLLGLVVVLGLVLPGLAFLPPSPSPRGGEWVKGKGVERTVRLSIGFTRF